MAIYRSQRTMAKTQYEESFKRLYADVRDRMSRVPKRRQEAVARPLMAILNRAYHEILAINEDPVRGAKNAADVRYRAICRAQDYILALQKPLFVYWAICGDPEEKGMKYISDRKRAYLCDRFNDVLKMLHAMQTSSTRYEPEKDHGVMLLFYYSEKQIEEARFLLVLRKLHRVTHAKITRLDRRFRDAEADEARRLIDDAWFHAVYGNMGVPMNHEQYLWRRKHFSTAISDLYKLERPVLAMLSLGSWSNREMQEWQGLLNDANKLLQAVQRSDRARFGSL